MSNFPSINCLLIELAAASHHKSISTGIIFQRDDPKTFSPSKIASVSPFHPSLTDPGDGRPMRQPRREVHRRDGNHPPWKWHPFFIAKGEKKRHIGRFGTMFNHFWLFNRMPLIESGQHWPTSEEHLRSKCCALWVTSPTFCQNTDQHAFWGVPSGQQTKQAQTTHQ